MSDDDLKDEYVIFGRPLLNQFIIMRNGEFIAAADSYAKIETIFTALVFSEKIDELAKRKEYK